MKCPKCGGPASTTLARPFIGEGDLCDTHADYWRPYKGVVVLCDNYHQCPTRFVVLVGGSAPRSCEECAHERGEIGTLTYI
jgi:hypothetical protein